VSAAIKTANDCFIKGTKKLMNGSAGQPLIGKTTFNKDEQ